MKTNKKQDSAPFFPLVTAVCKVPGAFFAGDDVKHEYNNTTCCKIYTGNGLLSVLLFGEFANRHFSQTT